MIAAVVGTWLVLSAVLSLGAMSRSAPVRTCFNSQPSTRKSAPCPRSASQSPEGILGNTVVTNVKGPPIPFYSCGAKLVKAYGLGPLADGVGTFHTALSYCGQLTLSVFACAKLMPDIDFYTQCLRAE